jgi:DNA-binding transcriptional ArsR family regulator
MSERQSESQRDIVAKLDAILAVLKIAFRETIEASKERSFASSEIKKSIYELCDGKTTVDEMSKKIGKSPSYVRVYLATLEEEGLVVRIGNTYEAIV